MRHATGKGEPRQRRRAYYTQFGPQGHQVGLCEKDGVRSEEMMAESEGGGRPCRQGLYTGYQRAAILEPW